MADYGKLDNIADRNPVTDFYPGTSNVSNEGTLIEIWKKYLAQDSGLLNQRYGYNATSEFEIPDEALAATDGHPDLVSVSGLWNTRAVNKIMSNQGLYDTMYGSIGGSVPKLDEDGNVVKDNDGNTVYEASADYVNHRNINNWFMTKNVTRPAWSGSDPTITYTALNDIGDTAWESKQTNMLRDYGDLTG